MAATVLGALALLTPGMASAVVSCSYDGATHTVAATATGDQNEVGFVVMPGSDPVIGTDPDPTDPFGDPPAPTACGAATTENTDTIGVNDNSPSDGANITIDMRGGRFTPGFTDESLLNASEIEFRLNVGGGQQNWLTIIGHDTQDDGISAGNDGITLNGTAEDGMFTVKDVDVTNAAGTAFPDIASGSLFRVNAGGGDDWIRADGSESTGSPVDDYDGIFNGGTGDDELIGGDGERNVLNPFSGNDFVDGRGADESNLSMGQSLPVGVTVDLALTVPQDTGGAGIDTFLNIDNMQGTDRPDVLKGTNGVNRIDGLGGADVIRGAGGNDELNGSLDSADPPHEGDTLAYDNFLAVAGQSVDLAAGTSSGGQGTDAITGFDNIIGSDLADPVLRGTGTANRITGAGGGDNIFGLAGADDLHGVDGVLDNVDCGGDSDTDNVFHDVGLDLLANCGGADNLNLPPAPAPGPPALPGPLAQPPPKKCKKPKKKTKAAKKKFKKCKKRLKKRERRG